MMQTLEFGLGPIYNMLQFMWHRFSREGLPPRLSARRAAITGNHISLVFGIVVYREL